MTAPMRVIGLDEFARGMRELDRVAPGELDRMLGEAAEQLLPAIRARTPVGDGRSGDPGRLKAATKITKVRGKPAFANKQVYANAIHWGRSKGGVIKPNRFIWDAMKDQKHIIEREIASGLNRLLEKYLP